MWIGAWNKDLAYCETGQGISCSNLLYWTDGTSLDYPGYFGSKTVEANQQVPCMRMRGNGNFGDRGCYKPFPFLCQYDCDNVYTLGKVYNML